MKTTTRKYNLSKIMTEAWRLYRNNAKVVAQYRHTFGECLRMAWANAKREAAANEQLSRECGKRIDGCLVWMRPAMVIADSGVPGWTVTGKTYGCKRALRQMGFRWDAEARCWATTNQDVATRFASC